MMRKAGLLSAMMLAVQGHAHAGMPSLTLTEAASARLDVISFFLLVFFASALLLRWAWNVLAKDFPALPRLRYQHAVGLLLVSSLFLYVVLTMISGARELMTPGAWVKTGATYQLRTPERDSKTWLDSARRSAMANLRDALWNYAKTHDGYLPPHPEVEGIPKTLWRGIDPDEQQLAYVPGGKAGSDAHVVAYEPDSYGSQRFVLLRDGTIVKLTVVELQKRLGLELVVTP